MSAMSKLSDALDSLDMSIGALRAVLKESPEPLKRRLSWSASELERLAGEAYRLADEADDGPECIPGWDGPLPGFDESVPVLDAKTWLTWEAIDPIPYYTQFRCPICEGNLGDSTQCPHYSEDLDGYFAKSSSA